MDYTTLLAKVICVMLSYLDSGLIELGTPSQLLTAVDVWIVGLCEGSLQLL